MSENASPHPGPLPAPRGEGDAAAAELPFPDPPPCPNCGHLAPGRYCPRCGQDEAFDLRRPLRRFLGETVGEIFSLDSRLAHTVLPFLFRPGHVAAEILAGRRARYSSPVRLYLVATFLFFLAAGFAPDTAVLKLQADGASVGADASPEARARDDARLTEAARGLREEGAAGAFLADRIDHLRSIPRGELQDRLDAAFVETTPKVLFFLVPVLALILKLAWRRRFYAEHLLVAVHAQSLAYLALLPGAITGAQGLATAGVLSVPVWSFLAFRRVYGEPLPRTALKFVLVGVLYLLALGLAMVATILLALTLL